MSVYMQPPLFFGGCTIVCVLGLVATAIGVLPDEGPDVIAAGLIGVGTGGYATFRCLQAMSRERRR